MGEYVLLYSGGRTPETEEEQADVMKAWASWFEKIGGAVRDQGNPFTPAAKSIASDGTVKDGPVGSMASGYSILRANTLDEAVGMAKGCPVLQGGAQISVFETFEVM